MRTALMAAGLLVLGTATGCSGAADSGASASPSVTESATDAGSGKPAGKPNGVEELPVKKLLDRAGKAALSARSVHVIGTSPQASLDLVVTPDASNGTRSAGDTTLTTRVVDGVIYIKADEAYWTQAFNAKKAKKIGDKWVAGQLNNPKLKSFKQTSTMGPLMRQFLVLDASAEVGDVGVAEGQPAVPVTGSVGTLWVATTGRPYP